MRAAALCIALLTGCVDAAEETPIAVEPEPLPTTPKGELAAFIACIDYNDFVSADMAGAWSSLDTQNTTCTTCHARDVELSGNALELFDALKTRTYVQLKFFSYDGNDVIVNERTIPNVGRAVAPHQEHPRFNAKPGIDATRSLYDMTMDRIAAGSCP